MNKCVNKYKTVIAACITLCLTVTLSGCRWFEDPLNKDIYPFELSQQGIAYSISWPDKIEKNIKNSLLENSLLVKLVQRPPISLAGLIKRCEKDKLSFKNILCAMGYFENKVSFAINTKSQPLNITLNINLGKRYRLGAVSAENNNQPSLALLLATPIISSIINFKPGDFIDLEKVFKGRESLKKYLQNKGYPFVKVNEPLGIINSSDKTVSIVYPVELNRLAVISHSEVTGLKKLNKDYIINRLSWKNGEVFSQDKLEKSQRKLLETGLLSSVQITPELLTPEVLTDDLNQLNLNQGGQANNNTTNPQNIKMVVKAAEGMARAVGFGAKYSTSEGVGGHLFWHHNNINNRGQHLGIAFRTSKREARTKLSYTVPDFMRPLQTLRNEAVLLRERSRAYVSKTYSVGSVIERQLLENVTASLGVCAEGGRIRREDATFNTRLLAIPVGVTISYTNNFLDPTRGLRFEGKITPYYGTLGSAKGMIVGYGGISTYIPFDTNSIGESRVVLANFVKIGSILNQSLQRVPPNKRFYSGGGDSIRSYGYQLLGPIDSNGVPEGGNSLTEIGSEIRFRATEKIGLAGFVEGGAVNKAAIPRIFKDMLWGTGVGIRYYSPLGPIRLDLAFPLKRRKNNKGKSVDSLFQFYLSIGQAF